MEKKKKSNVGLIILVVILLLACAGMGAFIFVNKDKLTTKDNSSVNEQMKNKNQKEVEESVTFSDSELEKYVNYISPVSIGPSAAIYDADTVTAKNLSAAKKIEYIGSKVYAKHTSTSDYQYNIISESDVKNAVEEVYGPNTYEKATFNLGCGDYTLNESEKNYYSKTGCGGTTATFVSNIVTDYKATKSKLEITTAYAFFDGMTNKIYKDYNKTISLDDYTGGSTEETNAYLKEYVKTNKDKLNTIVYTFESTDGSNYYFTGFKNNK